MAKITTRLNRVWKELEKTTSNLEKAQAKIHQYQTEAEKSALLVTQLHASC
jgi:hypothetical protein